MENIIKEMIEKAIYYKENLSLYDESRELLQFTSQLIEQMSLTINGNGGLCCGRYRQAKYHISGYLSC